MFDNTLRNFQTIEYPPRGSGRNERRIFHAARSKTAMGRIDHRNLRIRIRPNPIVKFFHRSLQGIHVARSAAHVSGLHQEAQLHCAAANLHGVFDDLCPGIGRPGKVVDIFRLKDKCFGAVGVGGFRRLHARGADVEIGGQSHLHVVGAEVGEELRGCVKLVAVPGILPPHADLGEPLSGKHKIPFVPGALHDFGKLIVERDLKRDALVWCDTTRQPNFHHGLIVCVVVIRLDKAELVG